MPLSDEDILVFLPANHPLAVQDVIGIESLASEPMVMFSKFEAAYLHHLVVDICADAGFLPIVAQETRHIHAIVALVVTGMGVALLPTSATYIQMNGGEGGRLRTAGLRGCARKAQLVLSGTEDWTNPVTWGFMQCARNVPF